MRQDIERLIENERESGIDMSYSTPELNPESDGHGDGLLAGIEREADAVIQENERLEREVNTAKNRAGWWQDACEKSTEREKKLTAAVYDSSPMVKELKVERDKLAGLWRNHLDEAEYEDDNDWERQARQMLCTDEDVEKRIQAEGADVNTDFDVQEWPQARKEWR